MMSEKTVPLTNQEGHVLEEFLQCLLCRYAIVARLFVSDMVLFCGV